MSVPISEKPADRPISWDRVLVGLRQSFRWVANLSFLGLIGTFVAAYMQYNAWRDEKNITRYREELSSAMAVFSEIAGPLSSMINLQEILFYGYKNALGHYGEIDNKTKIYLTRNANKAHEDYTQTRTALRKNVDVLAGKAELFIDWPIQPDYWRAEESHEEFMASERDLLRNAKFDCKQHMPDPKKSKLPLATMTIDWNRAKHHVGTSYYCLEELHNLLLPVRVWAEAGIPPDSEQKIDIPREADIKEGFVLLVKRLNEFISLSSRNIETIRLRDRTKGFFQHQFCLSCDS
jgi:hypothetical protein